MSGSRTTCRMPNGSSEQCKPDLMILDLRLKAGDALDLIKTLRVECPEMKGARAFAIR